MIPWVVARELRATLLDYLRSTWGIADAKLEEALFAFLAGPHGLFQGPYLRLGLPFAAAPAGAAAPLDVVPPYPPHLHQLEAWQRLSSRGQVPQATLITTGTGSGKTECFLYPILDHVRRERAAGKAGIKAIILYPMNALASDQAQRFAETIDNDERLRGRIRVGLFVGGKGQHREMGRTHVVDDNDRLRADPPDILLTNYRMLDLLLQRPKDAPLWKHNAPTTLRYLVLDELHTYDGAQGTDVACLIRRLGQRLGSAEALCPIGTSATVGGGADTRLELLDFASTLFDQRFPPEAFVGETRLEPRDLLPASAAPEAYPTDHGPWPEPGEAAEAHVRKVVRAWGGPLGSGELDRVALGQWVRTLPIVRTLLEAAHRRPASPPEIDAALCLALPKFAAASDAHRRGWLAAALSMLSFSQRESSGFVMPLASVQTTLWVREVRRLLSRVGGAPAFRFFDDAPPPEDEAWVPRTTCRDCGHSGWILTESGPGDLLGLAYKDVANAFRENAPTLRVVHDDEALAREQEADNDRPRTAWLDTKIRRLVEKPPNETAPRLFVYEPDGKKMRCPACGAVDTLRILAARSTTLSSVAVGHLFTTPLNTDRKLLAFSDSVQDAAHRAGFYGARTFRFALRSAVLAGVPRDGGRIPLANLAPATWEHWISRMSGGNASAEAELTALLLPIDLHWLSSAEEWHDRLDEHVRGRQQAEDAGEAPSRAVPDPSPQLVADVKQRLRWECTRELGVASRIGRTLEQSGCVSVTIDDARFAASVDDARVAIREKVGENLPSADAMATFLAGLVTRVRLRGGVCDPMLGPYVGAGGNAFLLNKQFASLLSPFGPTTSRPIFLTNAPKPRQFDSICTARAASWTVDWVARALGLPIDPALAAEVYLAAIPALVRHGILQGAQTDERALVQGSHSTAWGLAPEALMVSRAHAIRRCDVCSGDLPVVEGSVTDLRGGPCLRFRCMGRLREVPPVADDLSATLPLTSYYRRFYERETLGRLWSKEHTGLLERGPREELELEFKQRPRPDSPNLLSCTPTLEMGIDIGDLSATLLCSVPPGTSQYVQRVGRAGRKTGNALVLAFAATRAHDLYFFQEPLEAMAGAIHPPGCYLSAPEVLKRQALAFLFDSYAKDGSAKPIGRVRDALQGEEGKRFPQPFFDFVGPRRERLQAAFLEMFRGKMEGTTSAKMIEAFTKGADGLSGLERSLAQTTDETRRRREAFRQLVQKLDERLKQLDTDESEAKKVEDLEDEKRRLRDERGFVYHQLMSLLDKDLWGWLTEESRLPNYAFPERGVKLDAYIRREGVGREPEHHSWVRAPAAALTELAPFNTFYASARRVEINGVELKKEAPPTRWRFCRSCHHAAPVMSAATPEEYCPSCGDERWGDVGQARDILVLGQVFAIARHRDAVLGDDGDDRSREFYETVSLFEAKREASEAWSNDAAGFGFELQPEMVLRQLNLGKRDDARSVASAEIAGHTVPDVSFIVCGTCGQAKDPSPPRPGGPVRHTHRAWCPERKKPEDKQKPRSLHLLRELRSEALRLVVPFADGENVPADLANLRAALRVGLRRFYGGDPDFLDVLAYDEPLPAREGRRRYVVIMDRVPGGTGLLAELCVNKGAKLKEALEKAHDLLRGCACQRREPAVKACYQCLYAYREGQDLPLLDRVRALEIVESLLDAFGSLAKVDTIGTMTQSGVLESELEARFVRALEERAKEAHGTWKRENEGVYHVTVGGRRWLVRAQVELKADQVAVPCRADFVIFPEDQEEGVRPVAVFTDGLAYHVMPGSKATRLGDDARKRLGISQGGEMLSWSLTWKDVVSPDAPVVPKWFGDGAPFQSLQALTFKLDAAKPSGKLGLLLRVLDSDPLRGLVAYLEAPTRFAELAPLAAFLLLNAGKRQAATLTVKAHEAWRSSETAAELTLAESDGERMVAHLRLGEHARLLLDADRTKLGALLGDAAPLRATLRLDDSLASRSEPSFELSWRLWLRTWNALQVLPDAVLVTMSALAEGTDFGSLPPEAPHTTTAKSKPERDNSEADDRLAVVAEVGDSAAALVLTELLRRHPDLETPSVPFELRPPAFNVADDVEVAFPERKVAAYFDSQSTPAEVLKSAGWSVFAIERGLSVDALEVALGLAGKD